MANLTDRLAGLSPEKRELVEALLRKKREQAEGTTSIPRRARPGDPPPLSFSQERLWLIDQLDPGNPAYNIQQPIRLTGRLSHPRLERTFAEIVRRHESLRTTFTLHEGTPVQVIAAGLRPALPLVDLTGVPQSGREALALSLLEEEGAYRFDLRSGPLLRLLLVRLSGQEHVLSVTMHHIVSDGWSMGVLFREMEVLHEAFSKGTPSPLSELPVQFSDFAVWQRDRLRGGLLEKQLAYWKRQLQGAPHILELPTDRPRPAVQTFRGATRLVTFPPVLSEAVLGLCRSHEATPFMVLLAAWSLLLGRVAGQDDLLVGTPVAGRGWRELEELIGFFVNTLVVRVDLRGKGAVAPGFGELLGRVRETVLDAFSHQDLPFQRLVEELVPERDLSRSPLFQALFALQNTPGEGREIPGLSMRHMVVHQKIARLDLSLSLLQGQGGFAGSLEHNTDLFDGSTMERLSARYAALLEAVTANPRVAVSDLPLLLAGERQQLLAEWNDTGREYPREANIPALFAALAAASPEAPAVVDEEGTVWTYRRLDEESNRLARYLAARGIAPGARVGVTLERSADLLVALLAILKAGAAYVPLDPGYPDERLAFLLEDSGAAMVLVHGRTRERLAGLAGLTGADTFAPVSLFCLESTRRTVAALSPEPLPLRIPAAALAYVIYTSGSTGKPKGVAVPHRAILRLVRGASHLELRPDDRLAFNANTSFDAATFEIWATLLSGAALVVVSKELLLSFADLADLLRRERVTVLHLTTALFNRVVREAPEILAPLRCALFGGEASDPAAVARALATDRPERLLHMYGPTESTTFATWHAVTELAPGAATVPIGRPLANTTARVLDRSGEPVPLGSAGELFVGGDGLAWGYLNRPELTAERFVPDRWSAEPGGRLYQTGDLVRFRSDGALEFQGRIDLQVKIRGFRIEPGEVEALLASHPGVAACAVLARRDGEEPRLVAYVVPAAGAGVDEEALRAAMGRALPDYMVPSAFVFLEDLPLTPNGKVDRRALPEPAGGTWRGRRGQDFVPPRDELELRLTQIWEDLLGVRPVGIRDNFFVLGGHSLLALRLTGGIERHFGRKIPLSAVMAAPTVEQVACLIRQEPAPPRSLVVPIEARGSGSPLFLVHPVGGNVFCYLPMARLGSLDRPVYGIQSPDPEALVDPWTVETMAERYVEAVREVQPEGPWSLAGWSFGGTVAFEMARRLAARGGEVALLALIDPGPPLQPAEIPAPRIELVRFLYDLRGLASLSAADLQTLPPEVETIEDLLASAELRPLLPADLSAEQLRELFALFRANSRALGSYRPGLYGGRLTLIRATETAAALPADTDQAWSALAAGGAEIHLLPGDHYALLTPAGAAAIADLLRLHA